MRDTSFLHTSWHSIRTCMQRFTSVRECLVAFCRRALSYPLFRNWDLCMQVIRDTLTILKLGPGSIVRGPFSPESVPFFPSSPAPCAVVFLLLMVLLFLFFHFMFLFLFLFFCCSFCPGSCSHLIFVSLSLFLFLFLFLILCSHS